ncbi:flavodoxin family protein [Nocardiopsis ansamitocini]|uniref:NADPH-dependent FMN reductase-like domain-containing protein n=1 Tax=Nocardiopsis ansamitocini TaxID=1670832 RepID=A0A9W6UJ98_9ACTN|nr:NAD(P)H-dependent oxidoreductase [Nocardiopsis ansamitocini]GLU48512.1 hypothetical protein Nans01_28630 [Nocardiopsis ansamitocini]
MRAVIVNCTLTSAHAPSTTEALAEVVAREMRAAGVEVEWVPAVDRATRPGVESDLGEGDGWPPIRARLLSSEILVMASPTWRGRPSSAAQRVLERMGALLSETVEDGTPVACGRVAGVVVTGNEGGAHHVISEIAGGLVDVGYTVPGQAWVYWNAGPGAGPSYCETAHGHDWADHTARTMAHNLVAAATALSAGPARPAAVVRTLRAGRFRRLTRRVSPPERGTG